MAPVPAKQILPLLFFITFSISCLVLLSISSGPKTQIQTRFRQIPSPNPSTNFTFIIKVLTFNRLPSLSRCLNSLSNARYDAGDKVHLHIFIDHFLQDPQNTGSADVDQRLKLSKKIVDFVDGFGWEFGEKLVHYRTSNAGLQAQWLEAWWPASDDEFAFVVEDDLEVSPLYYRFLKAVILNYYYNSSNFSPSIFGASLQRPRFVPGKHGNKMHLDGEAEIFLYQLVGTWGQLLFPRPWKEFRLWYDTHKAKGMRPFLDGMVTTGWYKKMGEKIWTPWFIQFIHSRGYFNIYTNFHRERALAISHRDAGVNYGKTAGPDSYLLDEISSDFNSLSFRPLNSLKWYDFCFRGVFVDRIVRSSNDFESIVPTVQKNNSVILLSVTGQLESIVRNLLCHFEKLNIQNYLLIGPTSDSLLDLSRRGHPVVDAGGFSEFSRLVKSVNLRDSSSELIEDVFVQAYAVRKCLELGYDTWLVGANTIPVSSDSFLDSFDRSSDVYVGRGGRILFFRGSSEASRSWADGDVLLVGPLVKDSSPHESIVFRAIEKLLERKNVKFVRVDDMRLGLDIGGVRTNRTLAGFEKKFMFWGREGELDKVKRELGDLEMWIVDSDFSCTGVFCHQS